MEEPRKGIDGNLYSENKMSVSDILNADVVKLLGHGISSLKQNTTELFNVIADDEYRKLCVPILTFDSCLAWLNPQRAKFRNGEFFFISCNENPDPRNENDKFSVIIALLDANKKPIPVFHEQEKRGFLHKRQEQDLVCTVIPAGTLDAKLIRALNGETSVLIKL